MNQVNSASGSRSPLLTKYIILAHPLFLGQPQLCKYGSYREEGTSLRTDIVVVAGWHVI